MAQVTFEHVSKVFPPNKGEAGVIAVDELSLEVGEGEFLLLVGPSDAAGPGTAAGALLALVAAAAFATMTGLNRRSVPGLDVMSDYFHKAGRLGVDLFFVLSGFLIGGLMLDEWKRTGTIRVRRFLIRRAFKIWPAYLICLVVSSAAIALLSIPGSDGASHSGAIRCTPCSWA